MWPIRLQDEDEVPPGFFDREKVREFITILADGGDLPPDPRQEGLEPEPLETFQRRMNMLRDLWEAQFLPRKDWKVGPACPAVLTGAGAEYHQGTEHQVLS